LKKPAAQPYLPTAWEPADVSALQALQRGEATPDQQTRALAYVIHSVCATYDLSYRPDSDRDTAFAEGKRFVGLQIVKALHLNLAAIKQAKRQALSTQETGK
jgi:hypothetical protein